MTKEKGEGRRRREREEMGVELVAGWLVSGRALNTYGSRSGDLGRGPESGLHVVGESEVRGGEGEGEWGKGREVGGEGEAKSPFCLGSTALAASACLSAAQASSLKLPQAHTQRKPHRARPPTTSPSTVLAASRLVDLNSVFLPDSSCLLATRPHIHSPRRLTPTSCHVFASFDHRFVIQGSVQSIHSIYPSHSLLRDTVCPTLSSRSPMLISSHTHTHTYTHTLSLSLSLSPSTIPSMPPPLVLTSHQLPFGPSLLF